jgi:predicted transcriptional regulator of viral defense system
LTNYPIYAKCYLGSNNTHKGGRMALKKTLGPVSAKLISDLYDMGKIIFTAADISKSIGLESNAVRKLIHDLTKRDIIARLKPGKYIVIPQELGKESAYIGNWYVAAREIVKSPDYYISHYSAMDIHNMLTHPVTKVYITTPTQEYRKHRIIGNTSFEFIYTYKINIWGIGDVWVTKTEKARVSNIERTIIDCLYLPKYCGGIVEIVRGIWMQRQKIDFDKLLEYIFRFDKIIVAKRAGYILESLELKDEKYLNKLRMKLNARYYKLDPLLVSDRTYKNSWKLIANISPEEIMNCVTT